MNKIFFSILFLSIFVIILAPVFAQESEVSTVEDNVEVETTEGTAIEINVSDGIDVSEPMDDEKPDEVDLSDEVKVSEPMDDDTSEKPSVVDTPRKQIAMGVSLDDIQCNEGLTLIKKYEGTPACVKESSVEKLITRGWAA